MASQLDSRKVLADHVRKRAPKKSDGSVNVTQLGQLLSTAGKSNIGAAQRLLSGETSIGLELLDAAAAAFKTAPWELIRPDGSPILEAAQIKSVKAADTEDNQLVLNTIEHQLVGMFRGMSEEHRDDLMAMANRWYSAANPDDRKANPFGPKKKAKR